MSKAPEQAPPGKTAPGGPPPKPGEINPNWAEMLYSPERVEKWIRGEITLQELNGISSSEMLEMAVIGFNMYEQGRYEQAKVIFQGLNALDPNEGYYCTALGAIYLAEEDLEMAERCFDRALELNEGDIAAHVNRGEVYLRIGKILPAAKDFKRAVELDPEKKDPLAQRARVLARAALETIQAAEDKLKQQDAPTAGSRSSQTAGGSRPAPSLAAKPKKR
jgi:tetratricopeptide (TPR) repeat protein